MVRYFGVCLLFVALFMVLVQGMRIPAEWEPQFGIAMQYPNYYERSFRSTFARIIKQYQKFNPTKRVILIGSPKWRVKQFVKRSKLKNVEILEAKTNNAWFRDNGPTYALNAKGDIEMIDIGFNAWNNKKWEWMEDNKVPKQLFNYVGKMDQFSEYNNFINERGNFEFNGVDTLVTSLPCIQDRNPNLSKAQIETKLKEMFYVDKVVFITEVPPSDKVTKGHIDGILRFVGENHVLVAKTTKADEDYEAFESAARICQNAGIKVTRLPSFGKFRYRGVQIMANYINFLITDNVVILPGFGRKKDKRAIKFLRDNDIFPGREIVAVDARELFYNGGAIHCVTNDIPLFK